jgi:hypothetical protein
MPPIHLSQPILDKIGSYFLQMDPKDQQAFLYIWDQWIRVTAKLKRRMHEIDASKSLVSILPEQVQLNLPLLFDLTEATYVRAVASGGLSRTQMPVPGSNHFVWPAGAQRVEDVVVGDTLLLQSGAKTNTGDFLVTKIEDDGVLTEQVFAPEAGVDLVFRVDRGVLPDPVFVGCAQVYQLPPYIKSLPTLSTSVGPGGRTLIEGADFLIFNGHIGFYDPLPQQFENGLSFLFAPEAKQDGDVPFNNFGLPIRFRRETSVDYVRALQALWFALWNGDAVNNVDVGVAVLFGLPFTRPGVVESIARQENGGYEIVIRGGTYIDVLYLPADFPPSVAVGQEVGFQALTKASRVIDYLEEPAFIELFDLTPRILKFHTFFVVIGYDALQSRLEAGAKIDFNAVIDFVDRIKSKRKDFHLIVELKIVERVGIGAETPKVDAKLLAHACLGPNYANLMTIESFGSPGFAYPQGYHTNYIGFDDGQGQYSADITSVRDGSDTLLVENWDPIEPEEGALVGAFAAALMCSDRLIGVVDFIGGTSVVIVGAVASLTFIKPGDVLSVDSLIEQNMESFLVLGVELVGSDLVIELDRETQPEASLSFAISRLYDIIENKPGRVRLAPATLMLDGLDFDNPGQLLLVRKKPGGETMREEYESQASSGRVDFTDPAVRDCFDFDSDAIELVDRVKVTTYDKSDAVIGSHDQRHFDGDLDGSPHPSTPAPTTVAPTTAAPTTP